MRIISVNTCSNAMRIAMILGYYTFILHWIDIGTFDRRCQFTDQAFIKHVVALVAKNPPASAGDKREVGLIPGSGRFPGGGHGNPLQYSCLEKSPWTEEPGGPQSMGSQRVRHDWATSLRFAFAIVTYKVLISAVQPSDSVIHTYIYTRF